MIAKIIIAAAITLFFTPTPALFSQEHPEHPEHPKAGGAKKQVSTADISAGIKKHITAETSKERRKIPREIRRPGSRSRFNKGPR